MINPCDMWLPHLRRPVLYPTASLNSAPSRDNKQGRKKAHRLEDFTKGAKLVVHMCHTSRVRPDVKDDTD